MTPSPDIQPSRRRMPPPDAANDWLGLAEASAFLGIAGATLRRWADDGRVPVFTTPGGHRRFSRRSLQHLLPTGRSERPTLARLGASPERVVRAYRPRARDRSAPTAPWLERLSDADRLDFRERGRLLVGLLLEHLDAADPAVARLKLQESSRLAAEHGRQVAALGASMTEAVQGFLQFRTPFLTELASTARRRSLDTGQATELLVAAESAMDQLLLADDDGALVGLGAAARRPRRPRLDSDRHPCGGRLRPGHSRLGADGPPRADPGRT